MVNARDERAGVTAIGDGMAAVRVAAHYLYGLEGRLLIRSPFSLSLSLFPLL